MIALALALTLAASARPEQGGRAAGDSRGPAHAIACPAGSEPGGAAPPDGYEEWCEAKGEDSPGARRREGPARVYYDDGKIWIEEAFRAGVRDGPFVEWYRNGKKARAGTFVRGAKDGRWTVWWESGPVEEESGWRDGVPDGRFAAYWPNGKLKTDGRHCGGAQCGRWSTYDEGGRLLGSVDYGDQRASP